ncbi:hypothetical protein [Francisella adeliensis]|uniref:Proteinase inhibitor I42 chagasin domain-containing protein n=2 Tax=Francisella adeliensis TaxID=2007306 RepID=A0A2Z4XXW7_9GAMM|nr:hypothetical protein [Francisella adeliensis]AXA33273.1 hypothetical protein CDH04_02055 [Francisella adeliensis]MBK2085001.1 hypothetical protein [Francisella adeliensis]MBK2097008.1 hypothetical protein [Francisella adeliensis]QIW11501.1 hypothetical protein FZC43_02060 [Francisella adeliensis]QIW13376.1 hypothetical protein FZC44_02060 [Francisella adeliensis]
MRKLLLMFVILPLFGYASMTQKDFKGVYADPIVLSEKQHTFNIDLPVDSTEGYKWFLVSPEYGYVNAISFKHDSIDVENSKWGGVDHFKFKTKPEFEDVPQKIVLRFECFQPFKKNVKPLVKKVVILSN